MRLIRTAAAMLVAASLCSCGMESGPAPAAPVQSEKPATVQQPSTPVTPASQTPAAAPQAPATEKPGTPAPQVPPAGGC